MFFCAVIYLSWTEASVITFWCHSFRHTLTHPLDLESVYKHVLPGSGCPEVTTLHSEVGATVDYIFYSPTRSSTPAQKCMIDNQERSTMGGKKKYLYIFIFFPRWWQPGKWGSDVDGQPLSTLRGCPVVNERSPQLHVSFWPSQSSGQIPDGHQFKMVEKNILPSDSRSVFLNPLSVTFRF